ncbi:MAG: xylulokinase [Burkholderiaceae bacterium]|nr:xylulokinase [Burkholderiaceae bacterium]
MSAKREVMLGIDLGAGSLKALLITPRGDVLGSASEPVATYTPHPGWSEQDPADWWHALCKSVAGALARSKVDPRRIAAVSLTAGAHIQVLEDAQGKVLRPAIMWNDQRSRLEVERLRREADDRILQLGFNRCSTTWTLPQLDWVRNHQPEIARNTRRVYLAKDWLRSRLTGSWETDPIDAQGTLMFDSRRHEWSDELCRLIGWNPDTLAPVVASTAVVGEVNDAAARATGLAAGTPVVCGTSDTAAETYAAGMTRRGRVVIKLATAGTVSALTRDPSPDASVINYFHIVPDHWYTITATNACASSHRWLRDRVVGGMLASTDPAETVTYATMDAQAAEVAAGSAGLFFHPYLNGERTPYWDPLLRGSYVGLSFEHGPGHLVRALYEGVAYSLKDCLETLRPKVEAIDSARLTGGGVQSAVWRQILADVLALEFELPSSADASFGAALIAGIGVGIFADPVSAVEQTVRTVGKTTPRPEAVDFHAEGFRIYKDIQLELAPIHHRIHAWREKTAAVASTAR